MQLLASDARVVTDGGGKVRAALNVVEGADRVAQFLVGATRKRPDAWCRQDFTVRFAAINGLPGIVVDAPEGRCKLQRSRLRVEPAPRSGGRWWQEVFPGPTPAG
jgi:RNA polymerase sigma-70 factor (ECF subfamily)